ncbi:SGNH/GDSL hydrolase family protein [bacterium]|nr:SGNH/GDSL hydrolase family protein [bacterium]
MQPTNGRKTEEYQRSIRPRRKFLYSLVTTVSFLLVLEGAARSWFYYLAPAEYYARYAVASEFPQALKYAPHHYCCYRLSPHYLRGQTHHNSIGYRGREVIVPKPQNCFRILVLGGSTTYGEFIDDDQDTFPACLEEHLHRAGFKSVEVVNAGVPGYNSWESLIDFELFGMPLQPDLVIPYFGVNDVHCRLVKPQAYLADNSGRRRHWTEPLPMQWGKHSLLLRIIGYHAGLWRDPGIDAFVQSDASDPGTHGDSRVLGKDLMTVLNQNPPTYFEKNLKLIAAACDSIGARVMHATWAYSPEIGDYVSTPHYQRGIAELNDVIRKVADEQHAPFFDFAREMPTAVGFWRDGRHVNRIGADRQAELFVSFMIQNARSLGLPQSSRYEPISPPEMIEAN